MSIVICYASHHWSSNSLLLIMCCCFKGLVEKVNDDRARGNELDRQRLVSNPVLSRGSAFLAKPSRDGWKKRAKTEDLRLVLENYQKIYDLLSYDKSCKCLLRQLKFSGRIGDAEENSGTVDEFPYTCFVAIQVSSKTCIPYN